MAEYDVLRQRLLLLLDRIIPIAEQRGTAEETTDRLYGARERLRSGRLTVVVCGEYNRGKSSLLNALLEQPNLLPANMYIATRLVLTVSWGNTERVHVTLVTEPGQPPERRRIARAQIGEFAAQGTDHPDAERARLIEIELPDERLASGLVLVDTPGVGGVYHDHTLATQQYLPSADAVLFVASAQEPLSLSETDFLAEAAHAVRAADHPDALLFALTKTDLQPPAETERFAAGMRARIAQVTGRPEETVEILPVSSRAKLHHLVTEGGDDLLRHSGFPELEAALWHRLARHRARALLGGALGELGAGLRTLLEPLRAEEVALRDASGARLEELTSQVERESARLAELAAQEAPWRARLTKALEELRTRLRARADEELARVWTRAEAEYLHVVDLLQDPAALAARVNGDLGAALAAVGEWADRQAAAAQRDLARDLSLELADASLGAMPAPAVVDLGALGRLQRPTRTVVHSTPAEYRTVTETRVVRSERQQRFADGVGRLLGRWGRRAAEAALHVFTPTVTETLIRKEEVTPASRWEEVIEEEIPPAELARRREQLRAELRTAREAGEAGTGAVVAGMVDAFAADISADFDSRIARERERIDDTLARLRAGIRATEEKAAARRAELAGEQVPLKEIEEAAAELAPRAARLAGAAGAWAPEPEAPDAGGSAPDPGVGTPGPGDSAPDPGEGTPGPGDSAPGSGEETPESGEETPRPDEGVA
ncbi:dynamin family protein [Streptomyces sp. DSM 44917]|uniref:Dynamin family protein n=1 Tax=Streptomyces boetiae TaxID=3075541 RepID=A0ABU2L9Y0_9ACTN|nr:dynamin family protein [Streptomyces sp. DSM 44917]MDT0308018.1 dynamin family protein [Streptomyces sp. DSM 44917]